MAIKRKTINIKKVKLIRPTYTKPTPKKIVNVFTSPLGIRPESLKVDVKKKRKRIKSVKIEKPKQMYKPKKRFEFIKGKSLELKHKKKRVRENAKVAMPKTARIGKKPKPTRAEKKVIKQKKSTFASAFPMAKPIPYEEPKWSDDIADWPTVRDSIVNQFIQAIHSITAGASDEKRRPAEYGAKYVIKEFMNIPDVDNDDLLGDFLIENPVASVFDFQMIYDAGVYLLTDGRKSDTFLVDSGIEHYANIISGIMLAEMADGDYIGEY